MTTFLSPEHRQRIFDQPVWQLSRRWMLDAGIDPFVALAGAIRGELSASLGHQSAVLDCFTMPEITDRRFELALEDSRVATEALVTTLQTIDAKLQRLLDRFSQASPVEESPL